MTLTQPSLKGPKEFETNAYINIFLFPVQKVLLDRCYMRILGYVARTERGGDKGIIMAKVRLERANIAYSI